MENPGLEFGNLDLEGSHEVGRVENKLVEMDLHGTGGAPDEGLEQKDTKSLLLLFPTEVWEEILDKVTNKFEASNAALLFRNILEPKRVEFLFPQVWSILAPRINELFPQDPEEKDDVPQEWRLVCKSWSSGIDSYYQENNYANLTNYLVHRFETGYYDVDDDPSWGLIYEFLNCHRSLYHGETFDIFDTNVMNDFMAAFPDSNRNPFRLRSTKFLFHSDTVNVENPVFGTLDEFENGCVQFTHLLEKHGHHLWILHVDFGPYLSIFPSVGVRILRNWMLLVPNLKYFRLDSEWYDVGDDEVSEITQFLEGNPIPTLQNLKCLVLDAMPDVIIPFFLRPNVQIETFRVDLSVSQPTVFNILGGTFNNLNQISLKLLNEEDLACLEHLAPRWNLNKLNLRVSLKDATPSVVNRFFRVLETWKNTLTALFLSMDVGELDRNDLQLDLPELKRLNLMFSNVPIKIFASCRKLQVLEVVYTKGRGASPFLEVETEGQQQDPYSSPLWNLFPDLRRVYQEQRFGQTFFRRNVRNLCH